MKFIAHAGFRRDNGHLFGGELTDEHDTPTVSAWTGEGKDRVRVDRTTPFKIDVQGTDHNPAATYRALIHDLRRVIAVMARAGFTTEQHAALKRDMPNYELLLNQGTAHNAATTVQSLIHDLSKVIAVVARVGFTAEQRSALKRDVPNMELLM